jgi:hypothetical protein
LTPRLTAPVTSFLRFFSRSLSQHATASVIKKANAASSHRRAALTVCAPNFAFSQSRSLGIGGISRDHHSSGFECQIKPEGCRDEVDGCNREPVIDSPGQPPFPKCLAWPAQLLQSTPLRRQAETEPRRKSVRVRPVRTAEFAFDGGRPVNQLVVELVVALVIGDDGYCGRLDGPREGTKRPARIISLNDLARTARNGRREITKRLEQDLMDGKRSSFRPRCQRRSKNSSAGRSKNTSAMLAIRPPNWGPFLEAGRIVHRLPKPKQA